MAHLDFVVDISQSVVHVHAQLGKQVTVLRKHILPHRCN